MKTTNEIPRRLAVTQKTIQKLYAKSGNRCAFPECNKIFYDDHSTQNLSNICHIEAAEVGGQRFNPKQTNEDRRHYDNLILLCPNHHVTTDDVKQYTVKALKDMKQKHEELIAKKLEAQENVYTNPSIIYAVISCISESIDSILDSEAAANTQPFNIEDKIDYNSIVRYSHIFQEYSTYQCSLNDVYESLEMDGVQKNNKTLLTQKIRSLFLKLKTELSDSDLIIDKIKESMLIADLQNCGFNNEIIDISLDIIIVDVFMRCKIFAPPPANIKGRQVDN